MKLKRKVLIDFLKLFKDATFLISQGHPTDCFGGISVRKTCNRLKFSVRECHLEFSLLTPFVFGEIKMTFGAQK